MIQRIKKYFTRDLHPAIEDIDAVSAYDLWAKNYDNQPGNLMMDLDTEIFTSMLARVNFKGRRVLDFGCGTGRHWSKIYDKNPSELIGFDISENMLERLRSKYPQAVTKKIEDFFLLDEPENGYDVIVSTLTIAHVENLGALLSAWCRILRPGGEIILTDYHPDLLVAGGKRTFLVEGRSHGIKNFVHPVAKIKDMLKHWGFSSVRTVERRIDERVKHYYRQQNAMQLYRRFENEPLIYGLHAFYKCS